MKKVTTRAFAVLLLVVLTLAGTGVFIYRLAVDGGDWATFYANQSIYSEGVLNRGSVADRNGLVLATSMDYKEQEKPTPENPEAGRRFTAASGKVKAKDGRTNLRTLPTTEPPSEVAAQLTGEETAERLAVDADKGWTKLSYNGQIVYAVTNYLMAVEG